MPENASNIPLDDEDILDLTVVAEPGSSGVAAGYDGPPEPGGASDFGADLDALLDSLGADGSATAAPAPQAAPIADQTPVDYPVDPNEEMAMPEMSDIDSLLAELGAEIPAAPAPAAPAPAAPMPEFDGILAQAQAAAALKAREEAAAAALKAREEAAAAALKAREAAVASAKDDLLAELGVAAPAAAPLRPEPQAAVASAKDDLLAELGVAAPVAAPLRPEPQAVAVPEKPEPAPTMPDTEDDQEAFDPDDESLDLNELDALLDDILATAPEMSAPAAQVAPAADAIPVPDQALMPAGPDYSEEIAALAARVQQLEDAARASESAEADLHSKVQRLEEAVEVLESTEITEAMMEGFIETTLAERMEALLEPGSPFMIRVINEVRGQFADGAFDESLEKMAAAAAAKVIREEIANLMQEDG